MYLETQHAISSKFRDIVQEVFQVQAPPPALAFPPSLEMGDLSIASCFDLAKRVRQSPRHIAGKIAGRLLPLEGVEGVSIAGAGSINLHLDRAALALSLFRLRSSHAAKPAQDAAAPGAEAISRGKVLVEHTSINPNKAAHIGHLRNAVLGDTLARLLRFRGRAVEVQNYIDNTGVQVADVIVGFAHLEKKSFEEVQKLIETHGGARFDYYCWDLYARVFQFYESHPEALRLRSETLQAREEGRGEIAAMADCVSTAITRLHLKTMRRINVRYDLLVQESEILRLNFWSSAFQLMKDAAAIHFEENGKNRGCWVMDLGRETPDEDETGAPAAEDAKVIVRSNGTVTYVGKDIAYHLWKFAKLRRDFEYHRFHRYDDGSEVWRTSPPAESDAPAFGNGQEAYAVIDSRQSYLQDVVRRAFLALGYSREAAQLRHFSYELVGLSPPCADEMGLPLSDDDRRKGYVEVSGRKGLGIKADDLIDALVHKAMQEVRSNSIQAAEGEQSESACKIAVSALRYFLLKYTRRTLIAFDFKDALAFEGETGPYLQYTVVRARNISRKFRETHPEFDLAHITQSPGGDKLQPLLSGKDGLTFWELIVLCAQLEMASDQAISTEEPSTLAKYSFRLAQTFNNFYHAHHVLHEGDASLQAFLLFLVHLVNETLSKSLDLLGIEIPERM